MPWLRKEKLLELRQLRRVMVLVTPLMLQKAKLLELRREMARTPRRETLLGLLQPWTRLWQRGLPEMQKARRLVLVAAQRMGWPESEWQLNRAEDSLAQAWPPQRGCCWGKQKKRAMLAADQNSVPRR